MVKEMNQTFTLTQPPIGGPHSPSPPTDSDIRTQTNSTLTVAATPMLMPIDSSK